MKKSNAAFFKELSFDEKRALTISFIEFQLRNFTFEVENGLAALTQEQLEQELSELKRISQQVEVMAENTKNVRSLSETLKDLIFILKRGQREDTCRRLNYCLKKTLPPVLFTKLYEFINVSLEDIVFNKELFPPSS